MNPTGRAAHARALETSWRPPLIEMTLKIGAGLGIVWFAVYFYSSGSLRWSSTSLAYGMTLAWVVTACLIQKRLPEAVRIASVQAIFFVPAVVTQLHIPPNANTGLCYALLVLVTALFYGRRAGLIAIGIVFTAYVAIGLAWSRGSLPLAGTPDFANPTELSTWLRIGVGQTLGTLALLAIALCLVSRVLQSVERLMDSEELMRQVMAATNDGIWDWSLATNRVNWSPRMYELLKVEPGALGVTFDHVQSLIHPDDRGVFDRTVEEQLKSDQATELELRIKRGDGSYGHFSSRSKVIQDANGRALRMVGSLRDITERRRMDDALKSSESLLRQFVRHTPAAVAMFDSDVRYIQVSNRWLNDYQLTEKDLIGKSHYDVFPDVPQRWKDIHRRVLKGGVERCDEDPFPRSDGSTVWLQWEVQPWRGPAGEIRGLIMFTQVITERKEAAQKIADQITELQRWQRVTLGREQRSQQLKQEVNELCQRLDLAPRYAATVDVGTAREDGNVFSSPR